MRVIDRLSKYLEHRHITPHAFERICGVANGYIKKQQKGRGTVGSDIIEKIIDSYPDLSLTWLITGSGKMLLQESKDDQAGKANEAHVEYLTADVLNRQLKEKISILEQSLADKEKIIKLLEKQISQVKG